ncbi:MAG: hypothetical protein WCK53_09615 [Methanomicrobiales archaeon]
MESHSARPVDRLRNTRMHGEKTRVGYKVEIRRVNSTGAEVNQLLLVRIAPPMGWGAVVTCTFL